MPAETEITVGSEESEFELTLKRFANMPKQGWYSGDTHVHRSMADLPNLVMAEDLNVALPLNYWVRDSKEIPSASGPVMNVDLFELSNNHNWRTQFGFPQWTIENAPDWPEVERHAAGFTDLGWTEFAMQTYYALLNCGFRMRVTGGTGAGVHPVPLGHGRVYVHTGEEFSYEKWMDHLNLGHSFVTTGPLIDVRFNQQLPGTTWSHASAENTIVVRGSILSANPLRSIEVIRNGEIAQSLTIDPERTPEGAWKYVINVSETLHDSGWLALRCFEKLPDAKVSFAHTNPVFVDVPNAPLIPRRRDAEFFVKRMDEEIVRNTGILPDESLEEYRKAKAIYEAVLERAR